MILLCVCALVGAASAAARAGKRAGARHGTAHSRSRSPRHVAKPRAGRGHPKTRNRHGSGGTPAAAEPAATEKSRAGSGATIAAVLATPCEDTGLEPEPGNLAAVRAAVLCLINRERAEHGEEPLSLNRRLQRAAEEHDQELVADDYFAHVSPSGETPAERIGATGYIPGPSAGYVIGENLAWGTLGLSTPQAIVEAWIASPGHLANILEGQYRDTGIAVVPSTPPSLGDGQPGATYAQEFGVVLD
jgi:uncharacterized protein YkwD